MPQPRSRTTSPGRGRASFRTSASRYSSSRWGGPCCSGDPVEAHSSKKDSISVVLNEEVGTTPRNLAQGPRRRLPRTHCRSRAAKRRRACKCASPPISPSKKRLCYRPIMEFPHNGSFERLAQIHATRLARRSCRSCGTRHRRDRVDTKGRQSQSGAPVSASAAGTARQGVDHELVFHSPVGSIPSRLRQS